MRDLRNYAGQTNRRLIVGGLLLLFVVGDGLIYVFFGREAALLGLLCLGIGLAPLVLIGGVLWGIDWVMRKMDR
jgi:TM2 domain-containing membrane protein YozV